MVSVGRGRRIGFFFNGFAFLGFSCRREGMEFFRGIYGFFYIGYRGGRIRCYVILEIGWVV